MEKQGTTLITGATGFVGQRLVKRLNRPVVVSRNADRAKKLFGDQVSDVVEWDPAKGPIELPADHGVNAVVNLMGESVGGKRWNEERKKRIRDSRVKGTNHLVAGLRNLDEPPKVLVSSSAVGFYDDHGDEAIDEATPNGEGFLPELAADWEHEAINANSFIDNIVIIRTGLVLGKGGGVLSEILPIFRWGLGGKLGSGKQWMPWIHLDDMVELYAQAVGGKFPSIEKNATILNGVAPEPVRNSEFTKALSEQIGRPAVLPVPRFALYLKMGEFAKYVLASQRVLPLNPLEKGFEFQFDRIGDALKAILTRSKETIED